MENSRSRLEPRKFVRKDCVIYDGTCGWGKDVRVWAQEIVELARANNAPAVVAIGPLTKEGADAFRECAHSADLISIWIEWTPRQEACVQTLYSITFDLCGLIQTWIDAKVWKETLPILLGQPAARAKDDERRRFLGQLPLVYDVEDLTLARNTGLIGRLLACVDIIAKKGVFCTGMGSPVEFVIDKTEIVPRRGFRAHAHVTSDETSFTFIGVRISDEEVATLVLP